MPDRGWDEAVDVAVVGGGGAGLRAALSAAEAGARTALYEKADAPGGKTALSIGIMTASRTPIQRAAGVRDSHARHLADLVRMAERTGNRLDEPMVRLMIRITSEEIERLQALGARFSGPHPEGPHAIPRMHVIQPDCRALVDVLAAACAAKGVAVHTRSPGEELVLDHRGRVRGVAVAAADGLRRVRAGAVVLTAGDYSGDTDFIRAVAPEAALAEPFRARYTGDGHRMAMRIGAGTRNMHQVNVPQLRFVDWPIVEPSPGLFAAGARLIAASGERIATRDGHSVGLVGFEGRSDDLYILIDEAVAARLATASDDVGPGRDGWLRTGKPFIGTAPGVGYAYLDDCAQWSWHLAAPDAAAAARRIGCDAAALRAALGHDGPLRVLGPVRLMLMNTGGGLASDRRMRILSADGGRIAGLYGGGVNARLITYMGGHGYALAWAMASGRIAGENAAGFAATAKR